MFVRFLSSLSIATFLLTVNVLPKTSLAAPTCGKFWALDLPRKTRTDYGKWGFPLDQALPVRFRKVLYRIPAGYFQSWPRTIEKHPKHRAFHPTEINERLTLPIQFWMPSLRYVERQAVSFAEARPCEAGRQKPDMSQYVVRVYVSPVPMSSDGTRKSPKWSIGRIKRGYQNLLSVPEHGLIRVTKKTNVASVKYFNNPNSPTQIYLECTSLDSAATNPGCNGKVYDVTGDIYFRILFPRDELSQWKKIFKSVHLLLDQWRTPN